MAHIVAGKSRHHALLRTTQKMPFMLQFRWPLQTMFWHGGARRPLRNRIQKKRMPFDRENWPSFSAWFPLRPKQWSDPCIPYRKGRGRQLIWPNSASGLRSVPPWRSWLISFSATWKKSNESGRPRFIDLPRGCEDFTCWSNRPRWVGVLCWMPCEPRAMSRSELLFWAVGLAIFVLSEIVVVGTSHNRHSHRGDIESSCRMLVSAIRLSPLAQLPLR